MPVSPAEPGEPMGPNMGCPLICPVLHPIVVSSRSGERAARGGLGISGDWSPKLSLWVGWWKGGPGGSESSVVPPAQWCGQLLPAEAPEKKSLWAKQERFFSN